MVLHSRSPWLSPRGWGFFFSLLPGLIFAFWISDVTSLFPVWVSIWDTGRDCWDVLCGARSWTSWSPWAPSNSGYSTTLFFQNQCTITFQSLHLLRKLKSSCSSTHVPPNYFSKWQNLGKDDIFHLEGIPAAYLYLKVIHLYLFLCIAGHLGAKAAQQGKEKLCCLQYALNSLCIFIISIFMHPFTKLNRSYCLVIYNPENHLISKGQHRV